METVSWISLGFAIVLAIERIFKRIKKSKCSCCGSMIETEMTSSPSPKQTHSENQI
jgi:hypothetical protein